MEIDDAETEKRTRTPMKEFTTPIKGGGNASAIPTELSSKKRKLDDFLKGQSGSEAIKSILDLIRSKVQYGCEGLNTLNKEIKMLVDQFNKIPHGWKIAAQNTAEQLALYLSKSKQEMFYMLQRTRYLGERKRVKTQYDKGVFLAKSKFE